MTPVLAPSVPSDVAAGVPPAKRTALLVAGMHRSGTSAVTGALALLGCALPKHLMTGHADNPKGHFEPQRIVDLHDRVLAEAGTAWDDWDPFPERWARTPVAAPFEAELGELIKVEYGNAPLLILKDPRIARLIPLYRRALAQIDIVPYFVMPWRVPAEVSASLARRNGVDRNLALLIWARHTLDAERDSRNRPRCFISFGEFLQDWRTTLARAMHQLDLVLPRWGDRAATLVDDFLEPGLRHERAADNAAVYDSALAGLCTGVEEAYARLTGDPDNARAQAALDEIRRELDKAGLLFSPALSGLHLALARLRQEGNASSAEHRRLHEENGNLERTRLALEGQVSDLSLEIDKYRAHHVEIERLNSSLVAQAEIAAAKEQETTAQLDRLVALQLEQKLLQDEVRRLEDELDQDDRIRAVLNDTVRQQADRLRDLEDEAHRFAAREAELQAELASSREVERALELARAGQALVEGSAAWRLIGPLWRLERRHPELLARLGGSVRRLARLVTLRSVGEARRRRRQAADAAVLKTSALFDPAWYAARHRLPPGTKAHRHLARRGLARGLEAHPLFDAAWYLATYPEAAASRSHPFAHYVREGAAAGLDPHPLFDTAHYLAQLAEPPPGGVSPLEHYLATGSAMGLSPNRLFDPKGYALQHPACTAAGLEPLTHYAAEGERQGLDPHPAFAAGWYAARHPERGGHGPLAHFLREGMALGHPPSPLFEGVDARAALARPLLAFKEEAAPLVSIVIPACGDYFATWRCLRSLMLNTGEAVPYEIIVADDRPSAPIVPVLADVPGLRAYVNEANLGLLRSCNQAARRARGAYVLLLSNDTLVGRDWLAPMVRLFEEDGLVAVVGSKLINPDGTIQEAGGVILDDGWGRPYGSGDDPAKGEYNYVREVDVVTGACFAVRRAAFERAGGFDDRYAPAFYEDVDLAIALRAQGLRTLYQPLSRVVHLGSSSYGPEGRDRQSLKNHAQFVAKWQTLLAGQPSPLDGPFVARERPSPRGVILVIDDKVPEADKHAGAVTLFQYLNLMRELGLKVVFHPHDGQALEPHTRALQQKGIEVIHAPDTLEAWLARNGEHVDHVWTAGPYVTAPILDLIKRTTGARILHYTHDLHYLREMRRYELGGDLRAREESQRLKPMELGIFAGVDRVMTPSEEEAAIIRAEVPDAHVTVVPPYLFPSSGPPSAEALRFEGRNELVFVGGFDHAPNVDAARWLALEIMPLVWREEPAVRLVVVGDAPPSEVRALAGTRVEVTGDVRDVAPHYARARASVNPLRYGAGVMGMIVASLKAGVPVVTTSCGNEGIRLRDGIEAMVADDAPGLARGILALCRDERLCRSLALAGADVLDRQFSARRARRVLLGLLEDDLCPVCGTRPRSSRGWEPNWREAFSCDACGALNRTAAVADVVLAPYRAQRVASLRQARPLLARLRIHEFGFVGPIIETLRDLDGFGCSDFFDEVPPGERAPNGMPSEDLQTLTFADESFDLLISQEVFEHLPDPERAFREVFRVLRPGGRHVFSIPFAAAAERSVRRAVVGAAGVEHLLPPAYHGDPLRERGALVFTDFGADLPELLRSIGFDVELHPMASPDDPSFVFETTKPRRDDAAAPGVPAA